MRHDPIESYIFGNGGVESALGNVGVESREIGTEGTGDGAVLRAELCWRPDFEVLGLHAAGIVGVGTVDTCILHGILSTAASSESSPDDSCTGREEKQFVQVMGRGCVSAALLSIRIQNPP